VDKAEFEGHRGRGNATEDWGVEAEKTGETWSGVGGEAGDNATEDATISEGSEGKERIGKSDGGSSNSNGIISGRKPGGLGGGRCDRNRFRILLKSGTVGC
jgi:hypothetical protein